MSPTKQDDETAKDSMTPDFLKGIDISPEEEKEMEDAAYSGAADDIAAREGLSGDELKTAEENPASGTASTAIDPKEGYKAGFGYREEGKGKQKGKKKGSFLKRNQKWFIGGGLGSGIAGLILSFMLLLPLKVQHVVNNLQSHFFASSEKATQDMTDKLFTQYLIKKVMPDMYSKKACTTTRASKSCVSNTPGDGPIARLYNAWRDNNFEGKLAEKQGLEIRREGNKFYLKSDRLSEQVKLGDYDPKNPQAFERTAFASMDRTEIRRETRRAFENETFAKRIMYRFKVGRLLERKYEVKRCLVACKTRDQWKDRSDLRKLKWKAYFIDRVVTPRNEMLSLAMKCAIGGFTCTEPGPADEDGERSSEIERETRARIGELNNSSDLDSKEQISKLDEESKSIRENGLTNHIIAKLTNQVVADFSTKAVPILGWVQLAAQLNKGLNELGPALKKLNYVINSQTMVTMYMMYRTNADEIKTGKADAADIGIVANSLGPDNGTDQGGASAEEAPIYHDIMGGSSTKQASIFTGFVPKAGANSGYPCNDGSKISSGACPELLLNSVGFLANAADISSKLYTSIENVPLPSGLSANQTVDVWLATGGKIFDLAGGLIGHITDGVLSIAKHTPGLGSAIGFLEDKAADIYKILATWFSKLFINDILGSSPSGGRNFEIAAAGADVAGNSYAHYGLGGHKISDQAAAEIRTAMKQQEKDDFEHQPMFARMFDTSSQYSLVSKLAIALPTTTVSGTTRSMATSLLNPFASVSTQLSSTKKAQAATSTKDPFGVSQYGYDQNDEVFKADDLQNYWDKHDCSNPDRAKQWGDAEQGNVNPDTGMPENYLTNGCKLLEAATGMAGAIYDDSLLPADERGAQSSATGSGEGGTIQVMEYNTLRETDDTHAGQTCANLGMSNGLACSKKRAELQAKIISGDSSTGLKNPKTDVLLVDESTDLMFGLLKDELAPLGYQGVKSREFALFWNTQTLTKIEGGQSDQWSGGGTYGPTPWVTLQMTSGQRVAAMPLHYSSYPQYNGSPENTRKAAQTTLDWVKSKTGNSTIVLTGGDIGLNWKPAVDVFNSSGVLKNTALMAAGKESTGDAKGIGVDQIFVAPVPGLTASDWTRKKETGIISQASDHAPVWVTLSLPGSGGSGGAGQVGTSTMGDDYHGCAPAYGVCGGECVDFVKFRLKKNIDKNKFGDFTAGYKGISAYSAASELGRQYGYKVDHTPAVHAVVTWPAGGVPGSSANSQYGHVAIVGQVNKDGSMVIEEYNYASPGKYGTRTISANVAKLLTYAHTEVDYK